MASSPNSAKYEGMHPTTHISRHGRSPGSGPICLPSVSVIMETRLLFVNHQRGWSARRVVETGNAATVASNDGKAIKKAYCQGWEHDDSDRRALHSDMLGLAQPTLAASTRFHQGLDTADSATRPEHSEPAITALHTVDWAEQRKPAASIPISTEQVIPVGRRARASADRDRSRSLEPSGARVTHPHPSSRHRLHRVCLVLPCPSPSWQG
ncbi:hypothetical protein M432DRAFT_439983 [Thermoascus aurantiacus ATCC 26904]